MCSICGRLHCIESCPSHSGDTPNGGKLISICMKCNKKLYVADKIARTPHGALCDACANGISARDEDAWQRLTDKL